MDTITKTEKTTLDLITGFSGNLGLMKGSIAGKPCTFLIIRFFDEEGNSLIHPLATILSEEEINQCCDSDSEPTRPLDTEHIII